MGTYVDKVVGIPPVQDWFSTLHGYADKSFDAAYELSKVSTTFKNQLTQPEYTPPDVIDPKIVLSDIKDPKEPGYSSSNANHPGTITVQPPTHLKAAKPVFDVDKMNINIPQLPMLDNYVAPVKPSYDLNKKFPDPIDSTIPGEPLLIEVVIPDVPILNLPTFSATLPVSTIVVPGVTFSFDEKAYSDELLTKVKDELLIRLSGGTGLSPTIESAIWNRGRDREHSASLQAERSLLIESSQTGFTRPQGSVRAALDRATQESQSKILELSREIMIAQANLEQENIKTSIQQTIALEDILIRQHNDIQARSFEVAKFMQNIALEIYNATVAEYNLKIEAYKAESIVFKTLIDAELVKVETFKAQVEAQGLVNDINRQYVDMYATTVDAIKTAVEIYKVEVDAVSEQLRAEALKIEAYKTDVQAYSELVSANTQKYIAYGEAVKGESVKADIYSKEVDAYASRIQAYATEQQSYDSSAGLEIDTEKLKISQFTANLDGFIKQVQADQMNFQSQVDVYRGQASIYNSKVGFKTAESDLALKGFQSQIQQTQYSYDKSMEMMRFNADKLIEESKLKLQSMISSGSINAQLASSSLNAINVSASNSSSLGNTLTESRGGDA